MHQDSIDVLKDKLKLAVRDFYVEGNSSAIHRIESIASAIGRATSTSGKENEHTKSSRYSPTVSQVEKLSRLLDVNIKGAFFCTQRALKYMKEQNSGSIVNIGTGHWNIGAKDLAAYACSKGALHTLTMHTAEHFATHHIRCNWVTVGWVWSPGELESMKQRGEDSEEVINKYIKECIPFGQIQSATDIGHACVYFLSDISNQVTASDIAATGGFRV